MVTSSSPWESASYACGERAARSTSFRPLYAASTISLSSSIARNSRRWPLCRLSMSAKYFCQGFDSISIRTTEHRDSARWHWSTIARTILSRGAVSSWNAWLYPPNATDSRRISSTQWRKHRSRLHAWRNLTELGSRYASRTRDRRTSEARSVPWLWPSLGSVLLTNASPWSWLAALAASKLSGKMKASSRVRTWEASTTQT
mmetsp:Transcript_15676/g.34208  ORF Transcript_15676/g.34208 Transcript_15676/m.34208 type:complete len:202 (+) Transcript_15676:569-1174(+)